MEIKEEVIQELSQKIKTQKDLEVVTRQLMKSLIERALHAELDGDLGAMRSMRRRGFAKAIRAMVTAPRPSREILGKLRYKHRETGPRTLSRN